MADTYEKDLAQKSSLTTSDFIRVVGSDNVSYKQGMTSVKTIFGVVWHAFSQTTRETLLAQIDADMNASGQGPYFGYMVGTQAVLLGLPNVSFYVIGGNNSTNYRYVRLIRADGTGECILSKQNGTWASSPIALPTRAEVNALNSKTEYASYDLSTVLSGSDISGKVIKFGSQITIYGQLGSLSLSTGANALGTLSKYYPSATFVSVCGFVGTASITGTAVRVTIGLNGSITCYAPSALTGTLRFTASYATSNNS